MIFKTRPHINKQFDSSCNFGIENLIVSGASFTYNNHESSAVTWPYYLRDLGSFKQVLDCSLPGAGNHHISNSLIWGLEIDRPDPAKSLVVVMWGGCDHDGYICPESNNKNTYAFKFNYSKNVMSAITGGPGLAGGGNTIRAFNEFSTTKNQESRAIENYLYITNTWHYLKNSNYKFIFLNFMDPALPSRTQHFDIKRYLPLSAQTNLDGMIENITDLYTWSIKNDLLDVDDYHPVPDGHFGWTQNILVPHLKTLLV
jgi:hypothetical protein